ncbi:hypothetical protein [Runella sp.]|uniref:hypothetical protein n=1 Tax=Runella sp. TaxID=1960881 RepID=UPI003D0F834B
MNPVRKCATSRTYGKSFDFEEAKRKGSMGLLNILSRISILGGIYTSEPGQSFGTISTIRVPVD